MARPRNISRAALRAYGARRRVLMALGFDSYDAYLASDLWRRIRTRKLEDEGRICYGCGAPDCVQVHHGDYERPTLEGTAPHRLVVVCDSCHEACEYIGRTKLSPAEATNELRKLRQKNLGKVVDSRRVIC